MEDIQKIISLVQNLSKSKKVSSFDSNNEREVDRLANALVDFEKSFKVINDHISKLLSNDTSEQAIDNLLLDIGEELRHVIYHIQDAKFYSYLTYYKKT